ncbi:MAG: ATP-dependent metallopeptidase FtsH/Yme1/Tma family protein, partial [Gaiellaceae bacterium]
MNRFFRSALFPLVIIVLLVYLASQTLIPKHDSSAKVTLSQLRGDVAGGGVSNVVFSPRSQLITATLAGSGQKVKVHYPTAQSQYSFQQLLDKYRVQYDSKGINSSAWLSILGSVLPLVFLVLIWVFLMNQMQGGGSKVMSFGKSRAKRMSPDSPKTTYKDVAGADEAVEELQEIKEFLENPKKFQ